MERNRGSDRFTVGKNGMTSIYERGNAAKQWIFEELDRRFGQAPTRVLDLGCGDGSKWSAFLAEHPAWRVIGIDTDAKAIAKGQKTAHSNLTLRIADAQRPMEERGFDVVVAFSAIEHVVDRPAFLRVAFSALRSGGVAFLNYDDGHFRSSNLKERFMVPVSQLLAMVGVEGPYMKHVDDATFRAQAEEVGFQVIEQQKNNIAALKGLMRETSDEAIRAWVDFETRLSTLVSADRLDRVMLSTTLVAQKP